MQIEINASARQQKLVIIIRERLREGSGLNFRLEEYASPFLATRAPNHELRNLCTFTNVSAENFICPALPV